jgi:hypothetical protein
VKILIIIAILFFIGYAAVYWTATPALRRHFGPAFLISYFAPMAAGIASSSAPIFLLVTLLCFLGTTRGRLDAVCRFVLLALLLPAVIWRLQAGGTPLFDLSTVDVLAIGLVLRCLFGTSDSMPARRGVTAEDAVVFILFLTLCIGSVRFDSITNLLRGLVADGIAIVLPYWALRSNIRSPREFLRAAACFAAACCILALFAFYESRFGWSLFGSFQSVSDISGGNRNLMQRGGALRASATMGGGGALMLGIVMLIGFTAALYSRRYIRSTWMQAGWCFAILVGMIMTQSRGNLALFGVALLIFCVLRRKWGYVVLIGVGAPAMFGALLTAAQYSQKISSFLNVGPYARATRLADDVYDYRQLLLTRGMEEAAKHRWTGISKQDVLASLADITQGQGIVDLVNVYLNIYLVSGLLGVMPFMMFLLAVWFKLGGQVRRFGDPDLSDLRAYAITILAVMTFQLAFMSLIDRMNLCLGLALAASRLVGLERARLRAAAQIAFSRRLTGRARLPHQPEPTGAYAQS